jgi:hypothetical protein
MTGDTLYGYTEDEHEYTVAVPKMYAEPSPHEPDITIAVSAHGGGTVGKSYANNGWDYAVYANGVKVISGQDLRSAPAKETTHAEIARSLCSFLASDIENGTGEYDATAREFLEAEDERLVMFAMAAENEAEPEAGA